VFGTTAGLKAAARARGQGHAWSDDAAQGTIALIGCRETKRANPASLIDRLQMLMDERVGPLRSEAGLSIARAEIAAMKERSGTLRRRYRANSTVRDSIGSMCAICFSLPRQWSSQLLRGGKAAARTSARIIPTRIRAGWSIKRRVSTADGWCCRHSRAGTMRRGNRPYERGRNPDRAARRSSGRRFLVALRDRFRARPIVLDALRRIRIDEDPTLAFRFSCINANACKECLMLLDGKVVYACTARLKRARCGSSRCQQDADPRSRHRHRSA